MGSAQPAPGEEPLVAQRIDLDQAREPQHFAVGGGRVEFQRDRSADFGALHHRRRGEAQFAMRGRCIAIARSVASPERLVLGQQAAVMQIERCPPGLANRPVLGEFLPLARAIDEELDRRFILDAGVVVLQPQVEPAQLIVLVLIDGRSR